MTYYDTSYPPSLWEIPAPIPPTGVTVGTPGSFTPAGSDIPNDLAELNALGALGQTIAWITGQYVVLGNATNAHWSGTLWVSGIATTQSETFTAVPVDELPPTEEPPVTE